MASTSALTDAKSIFGARKLQGKLLSALQQERASRDEEAVKEAVINAADLRSAFADMGDEVPSKDLFALVQHADPDGDGIVPLPRFLEVVEMRRAQLEKQREEALLVEAYHALGGDADRDARIKSSLLTAITSDFVGSGATSRAMEAVVAHKLKAVQEILGMGGSLDEEDEAELKDTTTITFEELGAFATSLHEGQADPAGGGGVADDGEDGALK